MVLLGHFAFGGPELLTHVQLYYTSIYISAACKVFGWNMNRKPGIGLGKISHEMPIFAVFLLKKGSLCSVCVYIVAETENPDTQDLPKKVPSRTTSLLKVATFGPKDPHPAKHIIYAVWLE